MLETHTTRAGETMLIAQMDDVHLTNFIKLILRTIEEAQGSVNDQAMTPFDRRLYGIKEVSDEDAADVTRLALQRLYPYLTEAYLRNLEVPREKLVKILGRDSAFPKFNVQLLPEGSDYYNKYDDYEEPFG